VTVASLPLSTQNSTRLMPSGSVAVALSVTLAGAMSPVLGATAIVTVGGGLTAGATETASMKTVLSCPGNLFVPRTVIVWLPAASDSAVVE